MVESNSASGDLGISSFKKCNLLPKPAGRSQMAQAAELSAQEISGAMENQQANEAKKHRAEAHAMKALNRGEASNHALLKGLDDNTSRRALELAVTISVSRYGYSSLNTSAVEFWL